MLFFKNFTDESLWKKNPSSVYQSFSLFQVRFLFTQDETSLVVQLKNQTFKSFVKGRLIFNKYLRNYGFKKVLSRG